MAMSDEIGGLYRDVIYEKLKFVIEIDLLDNDYDEFNKIVEKLTENEHFGECRYSLDGRRRIIHVREESCWDHDDNKLLFMTAEDAMMARMIL
jgi:hypothetical protein